MVSPAQRATQQLLLVLTLCMHALCPKTMSHKHCTKLSLLTTPLGLLYRLFVYRIFCCLGRRASLLHHSRQQAGLPTFCSTFYSFNHRDKRTSHNLSRFFSATIRQPFESGVSFSKRARKYSSKIRTTSWLSSRAEAELPTLAIGPPDQARSTL